MSPTVFQHNGYRFFFFSREEERKHIHIISGDGEAKFWLEPDIKLANNYKYSNKQLRDITQLIEEHHHEFIEAWQKYFKS